MPTYRLDLEYDGTDFHGWQVQPGLRTVQGELMAALEQLCQTPVKVTGAGRTDAGVHARMQVASFRTEAALEPHRLLHGVNGLVSPAIRVWRAGPVAEDFSARGSARERRYVYRMLRAPSVFCRRTHFVLRWPVDTEAMQAASEAFLGTHAFTAFAAGPADDGTWDCEVRQAQVTGDAFGIGFEIAANRFLHNMVRRIAGTLVEVGRGRLAAADVAAILASGDPRRCGPACRPWACTWPRWPIPTTRSSRPGPSLTVLRRPSSFEPRPAFGRARPHKEWR
jgi:tRNA pseudouridine38-40 synthase